MGPLVVPGGPLSSLEPRRSMAQAMAGQEGATMRWQEIVRLIQCSAAMKVSCAATINCHAKQVKETCLHVGMFICTACRVSGTLRMKETYVIVNHECRLAFVRKNNPQCPRGNCSRGLSFGRQTALYPVWDLHPLVQKYGPM